MLYCSVNPYPHQTVAATTEPQTQVLIPSHVKGFIPLPLLLQGDGNIICSQEDRKRIGPEVFARIKAIKGYHFLLLLIILASRIMRRRESFFYTLKDV